MTNCCNKCDKPYGVDDAGMYRINLCNDCEQALIDEIIADHNPIIAPKLVL